MSKQHLKIGVQRAEQLVIVAKIR